ncbi:MAG: hypothetical protein ACE5JO_00410 [Candidatus Binatia bacterium]
MGVGVEILIPPDKQERATQNVLEQAQLLALDWAASRDEGPPLAFPSPPRRSPHVFAIPKIWGGIGPFA